MNLVLLMGNLGRDPETKVVPSGNSVCEFSIATTEHYKDSNAQTKTRTDWHRIKVWGKVAENCQKYLKKGSSVFIEGQISTRSWKDKNNKLNYITEITASKVQFFSNNKSNDNENNNNSHYEELKVQGRLFDGNEKPVIDTDPKFTHDEIPF